jgi:RHS repeat-associated protein
MADVDGERGQDRRVRRLWFKTGVCLLVTVLVAGLLVMAPPTRVPGLGGIGERPVNAAEVDCEMTSVVESTSPGWASVKRYVSEGRRVRVTVSGEATEISWIASWRLQGNPEVRIEGEGWSSSGLGIFSWYYLKGGQPPQRRSWSHTETFTVPETGEYELSGRVRNFAGTDLDMEVRAEVVDAQGNPIPAEGPDCLPNEEERSSSCNRAGPGANAGTGRAADPVTTELGSMVLSATDLEVPSRGGHLVTRRTYNSIAAGRSGPLGPGWSWEWGSRVEVDTPEPGLVTVWQPCGPPVTFWPAGNPTRYVAGSWINAELAKDGDDWLLTMLNGDQYRYDEDGALQAVTTRDGYATKLGYEDDELRTIRDLDSGRELTVEWEGDRVLSVTDPEGRAVVHDYDAEGRLERIDGPAGSWWFDYDDATDAMTRVRHPQQVAANDDAKDVVSTYTNGRITQQTDNRFSPARTWEFSYDHGSVPGATRITDPSGKKRIDQHVNGRRTKMTVGAETSDAITHAFGYDSKSGHVTTIDVLEGAAQTPRRLVTNTYDDVGNQLTSADASGGTWTATYDDFGRPLTVTDPDGIVTTWVYNATTGELSEVCTPLVALPPTGETRDCLSSGATPSRTTLGYDPAKRGDVVWVKDPTRQDANPANADRFTYGAGGQVEEHLDAAGNKSVLGYDGVGRLESMVAPLGYVSPNNPGDFTTLVDTDAAGRVTRLTNPLGHFSERAFTASGAVDWERDGDGNLIDFHYNDGGELIGTEQGPSGAPDASSSTDYWPDGRVRIQRNGAGAETEYLYAASGLLRSVEDPSGAITSYGYDTAGRATWKQDPGGDCASSPGNGCTRYGYDNGDRLVTVDYTDPGTPDITAITYDDVGRRRTMVAGDTWTWNWDSVGRLQSAQEPQSGATSYGWDLAGRSTSVAYPGGPTLTRAPDAAGRLHASTVDGATTTFDHDANSNLTSIQYPTTTATRDTFTFNRADQLTGIAFRRGSGTPPAAFATIDYVRRDGGGVGSVTQTGLPNLPGGTSETYEYDGANRITEIIGSGTRDVEFDTAGNLSRRSDGTFQAFDPAGRLCSAAATTTSCTTPALDATSYSYDDQGNRRGQDPSSSTGTTLAYDQADRLTSASVPRTAGNDGEYTPVLDPTRILDTRSGSRLGACPTTANQCTTIGSNQVRTIQVTGRGGIPASGVSAVSLTLSAVNPSGAGDLTVSAADAASGGATTVAYAAGETVSTSVIVKVSSDGRIKIHAPWGGTDVLLDVQGWFATSNGDAGSVFNVLDSQRILSTRAGEQLGACPTATNQCTRIPAGGTLTVQVAGRGGVPASGATAVAVNVIATGPTAGGWLALSDASVTPLENNVQYQAGETVANGQIVKLSANGRIKIKSSAETDVLLNVQGWFGSGESGTGSLFTAQTATRILDTRSGTRTGLCPTTTAQCTTLPDSGSRTLQVTGRGGVPASGVTAVAVNLIVTNAQSGWIEASRADASPSGDGEIFYQAGQTTTTNLIVPLSSNGRIRLDVGYGGADVLIDVQGWFSTLTETWAYTYDPTGLRRTKTAPNGTVTRYSWDRSGEVPLLLSETTGAVTTRYFYGPGGQPYAQKIGTGGIEYLHADQIGSIRAITNAAGATVATTSYDVFGTTSSKTGSGGSRFGFAGQYTDAETGFLYLRARYYDPTTAQFLTRDPLVGISGDPYGYGAGNPLSFTDPTGELPILVGFAVAALSGAAWELGVQALENIAAGCDPFDDIDWKAVGISAGLGAITFGASKVIKAAKAARAAKAAGSRTPSLVDDTVKRADEWLGPDVRMITNGAGDKIFLSDDGLRRIRFDLRSPAPHASPHAHVEEFVNGRWVKSGPIFPTDVPPR